MTWTFRIQTQEHIGSDETGERAFVMLLGDKSWGLLVDGTGHGSFLTAGAAKRRAEQVLHAGMQSEKP